MQQVDWMFNVAVAAGVIALAGGAMALENLSPPRASSNTARAFHSGWRPGAVPG